MGEADEQPDDEQPDTAGLSKEQLYVKERFEELGFTAFSAVMLACLRADWHHAKHLLERAEPLGEKAHDFVYDQLT